MKDIDWSKAPLGSTHWDPLDRNHLRQVDGSAQVWDIAAGWEPKSWQYPADLSTMSRLIARPVWDGKGLPPVGVVCEFAGGTHCPEDPFDKDLKEGMPVTIIAHFKSGDFTLAAFTFDPKNPDRSMAQVEQGNFGCFRPIRSAEQIAADERAAAIEEISQLLLSGAKGSIESVIYDAGYRKQVQP